MSRSIVLTSLSKRFHFTPASSLSAQPRNPSAPKLILLFGWMGAKVPHLQKYVNGYSAIWPSTPIIVVSSLAHDFRPLSRYAREYGPLVSLISQYDLDLSQQADGNEVLIVTMSNGGCWSLDAYLRQLPAETVLRPRAVVHDSCPGLARYTVTLRAFLIAGRYGLFSKAVAAVVITIYYCLSVSVNTLLGRDPIKALRSMLLERIEAERRTYIYSKGDALINFRDVESHADTARRIGGLDVKLEEFHNSPHVMHLKSDEERYWRVIQDVWNPYSSVKDIVTEQPSTPEVEVKPTPSLPAVDIVDSSTTDASISLNSIEAPDAETLTAPPSDNRSPTSSLTDENPAADTTTKPIPDSVSESSDVTAEASKTISDAEDSDDSDSANAESLDPSILGTKEYWEAIYRREVRNHTRDHTDEGEIWFGEESEDRMISYLSSIYPPNPPSPKLSSLSRTSRQAQGQLQQQQRGQKKRMVRALDLGTGNGHLLFRLYEEGFRDWDLVGIDYSSEAIKLARAIAQTRGLAPSSPSSSSSPSSRSSGSGGGGGGGGAHISFRVEDFLLTTTSGSGRGDETTTTTTTRNEDDRFDVVLDKGTFDAISLSDTRHPTSGKRLFEVYAQQVVGYMTKDAKLVVTSCNWTQEELIARLTGDGHLRVHAFFKAPKKTFQFGGKTGSTTSQVVFRRAK